MKALDSRNVSAYAAKPITICTAKIIKDDNTVLASFFINNGDNIDFKPGTYIHANKFVFFEKGVSKIG